jgi:hypothetical protein
MSKPQAMVDQGPRYMKKLSKSGLCRPRGVIRKDMRKRPRQKFL